MGPSVPSLPPQAWWYQTHANVRLKTMLQEQTGAGGTLQTFTARFEETEMVPIFRGQGRGKSGSVKSSYGTHAESDVHLHAASGESSVIRWDIRIYVYIKLFFNNDFLPYSLRLWTPLVLGSFIYTVIYRFSSLILVYPK